MAFNQTEKPKPFPKPGSNVGVLELATNQNHTYIIGSVIFTPVSASASVTCGECFDPGACNFVPNALCPTTHSVFMPRTSIRADCTIATAIVTPTSTKMESATRSKFLAVKIRAQLQHSSNRSCGATESLHISVRDNDDCDGITFNVDMAYCPQILTMCLSQGHGVGGARTMRSTP